MAMTSESASSSSASIRIIQRSSPSAVTKPSADATRSPVIHPSPPVAAPTTALLNARRHNFEVPMNHVFRDEAAANVFVSAAGSSPNRESCSVEVSEFSGHARQTAPSSRASMHTSTATTTTKRSSTPPPNALVMDTLVQRYRATESRLERWRRTGGDSRTAAAAAASAVFRNQQNKKKNWNTDFQSSKNEKRSGATQLLRRRLARALQAAIHSVLERGATARTVRSWWKQQWEKRLAASSDVTGLAAVGKRDTGTHVLRSGMVTGNVEPTSWLRRSSRHLLGRLSSSLALSSDRDGESSQVLLVDSAGNASSGDAPDAEDERGERNSNRNIAGDTWGEAGGVGGETHSNHAEEKARRLTIATLAGAAAIRLGDQQSSHWFPFSFSSTSSFSENNGSSFDEGSNKHRVVSSGNEGMSASPPGAYEAALSSASLAAAPVIDDGCFTLSWIRSLHCGLRSATSSVRATGAEESFRSASRLLTKSRARFTRWLQRQRRLQSAKRESFGERLRRRLACSRLGNDNEVNCDAAGADGNHFHTADARETTIYSRETSRLRRAMLQRVPSSWERALPCRSAIAGKAADNRASADELSPTAQRVLVRTIQEATVAAAAGSIDSANKNTSTPLQVDGSAKSSLPTRAAQETRAHADALSRLGESIKTLTSALSGTRAKVAVLEEKDRSGTDASSLGAQRAAAASTILSSHHSTYPKNSISANSSTSALLPPQQQQQMERENAKDDVLFRGEVDAFRSLLVDTTHTAHDTRVRAVYEEVMREVCTAAVQQEVDAISYVSHIASDRALSQWVERQLLSEIANLPSRARAFNAAGGGATVNYFEGSNVTNNVDALFFTGVLAHIRSRVPVSLSTLHLDDADRRALASVYERKDSDAIAASLQTAGYSITYRQLASLNANSWLNDQVINNYLQLLCEDVEIRQQQWQQQQTQKNSSRGVEATTVHSIASMGTHFYSKVESELTSQAELGFSGPSCTSDSLPPLAANSATLRWLRRRQHLLQPFKPADPRSVRAVLIPVNIEGQHWALVVYCREDQRWVLYDSMSRSDRARQRGLLILSRLSYIWRECQRHYGFPVDDSTMTSPVGAGAETNNMGLLVAAAYAPSAPTGQGRAGHESLLDSLHPYGSLSELRRAAKRLRHQEEQLTEEQQSKTVKEEKDDIDLKKYQRNESAHHKKQQHKLIELPSQCTPATSLPSTMLTDTEIEWFTGGFQHIPQQRNGNDCGVFVCQVAWCVAHGVAVSFTQTDVTLLRHVITLELLSKTLLRRYPTEHTSSSADV